MNILIFKSRNDFHGEEILKSKIYNFLNLLEGRIFIFDYRYLLLTFLKLLFNNHRDTIYVFFNIVLLLPVYLFSETRKIYCNKNKFYNDIRNCINDAIERVSGDIRTRETSNQLKKDYKFLYFLRSIKMVFTLRLLKVFKKIHKIDIFFLPQLDGYPNSGIWSYCYHNNIYSGSFAYDKKLWIMIRKEKICESLALKEDHIELSKLSDEFLNSEISKLKNKYISTNKNNIFLQKYSKKDKKIGVVLLHVFTDQARIRLGNSWQENYYDWLIETINLCKKNRKVKWIFKAHPFEYLYPIRKDKNEMIINMIKGNGFEYIPPRKDITHGDIAEIASFIVTCTGTAKFEYPALFEIPVISCIGEYLLYDSNIINLTAKTYKEYENLILNAHDLKITSKDIRYAKELLAFFSIFSGVKMDKRNILKTYLDNRKNLIFRNF